jgi:lactoylglutathione lyase
MGSFRFDHVSLYVRDLETSARFYSEVLGLQEIENKTGKRHIRWFALDEHHAVHLISGAPDVPASRHHSTHVALSTTRFNETLKDLAAKGVAYQDLAGGKGQVQVRADGVRQTYFQDPDLHWIEINEGDKPSRHPKLIADPDDAKGG